MRTERTPLQNLHVTIDGMHTDNEVQQQRREDGLSALGEVALNIEDAKDVIRHSLESMELVLRIEKKMGSVTGGALELSCQKCRELLESLAE